MNAKEFMREVYLRATPSIDLETATETIAPWDHRIKISEYDKILDEFGIEPGSDEQIACNMWVLNNGPQLVEG